MRRDRIKILYEDKFIIIVSKPPKLLTISTDKEKEKTMYHQVLTYVKQKHKSNKIFIVHRLDKDTSGILIFAKDEITKRKLQENWNEVKRYYIALVEGNLKKTQDTIKSYLKETKTLLTYSTKDKSGKLAITKYKVIKENKNYSLLDIEILTGRKNQIRVHMKDINHPIVGDKKYDSKTNIINRLGLHAYKIVFKHPITKKELVIEDKVPTAFVNIFK